MKVFVGCSSSNRINKKYLDIATKLGSYLSKNNNHLIFGASSEGSMGAIYREMKKNKCKITGIVSKTFIHELDNLDCDYTFKTNNSYERFKLLETEADILIFLPGGIGSYTELLIAIDMKRNKEINKNIIIINQDHYYDDFINIISKTIDMKFAKDTDRESFIVVNSIENLEKYI